MKAMPKTEPKIEDFFQNTKSRRSFIAGEKAIAYDVDQLLTFERNWLASGLGRGEPRMAVLVASWRRARDSWQRIMEALPLGRLRDEMQIELVERDKSMDALADKAEALIAIKLANGEVDA
jgi:hypothetical protein